MGALRPPGDHGPAEFPLACAFLDHYLRDVPYLAVLAQEARAIVRTLRNHPSLIAWCGGNEINIGRERLPLEAIARAVAEEDGTRPFIPASPARGDVHQWDVWHGFAPWEILAEERTGILSEFSLQALPVAETIAAMFPDRPPEALDDPRRIARQAQVAKLRWHVGPQADARLKAAIEATQRSQTTALQAGIEACRRRRGRCTGVAFWQFNEPWPAVSWSVVDRFGRPKLAYEMLRRAFQPALTLRCAETVLAANRYDLAVHLPGRGPWRACLTRRLADRLLAV
ncbi:MAG: glycoside hydrolase family 2 TIM barrel-domain containing protein [Anaerolineae bacterium]